MALMDSVKTYGPRVLAAIAAIVVCAVAYTYLSAYISPVSPDETITGKEAMIGSAGGVRIFYLSSRKDGYNAPDGRITLAPGTKEGEIRIQAIVGNTDKGKQATAGFQAGRVLTGTAGVFSGKTGASGKDITVTFAKNAGAGGGTLAIGDDTYTFAPGLP